MGRGVVISLAAVAVFLVAALAITKGGRWWADFAGRREGTPSIMIVSREVLMSKAEADIQAKMLESALAKGDTQQKAEAKSKTSATKSETNKGDDTKEDIAKENTHSVVNQIAGFSVLLDAMEDALGGKVAEEFQNSNRFRLIPQAKIIDAMDEYANDSKVSVSQLLAGFIGPRSAARTDRRSSDKQEIGTFGRGLTQVASKVGANFTLVITIGQPNYSSDYFPESGEEPARRVFAAQPIVNVEIFESNGAQVYRFSQQLAHPVVQSISYPPGVPIEGVLYAGFNKFNDRLAAAAARMVLELVLDKIAPARIVETTTDLVINRGTNDGVKEGAVYNVAHEVGEDITEDSGANLGKVRKLIGTIVIQSAQEQISTASTASGGSFVKGDIVLLSTPAAANVPVSTAPAAGPPGKPATVNVAVDEVSLKEGDKETESPELGETVSGALAIDSRVSVLARAELSKLRRERALNGRASGDFALSPDEGLLQSSYLVSGECSKHAEQHDTSISISGVSKVVSSHRTVSAHCTLRATSVDDRLIAVAQDSGDSLSAAAEATARTLLPKLLAAVGIAPSAAEAPVPVPAAATPPPPTEKRPRRARNPSRLKQQQGGEEIHF